MKVIKVKARIRKRPEAGRIPAPGERVFHNGHPFIALGVEQGGLLVISEEMIGEQPFDKDGSNDWRSSSLRNYLNGEYLDQIGREGLLPFTSDLTTDDGMKDYGASKDYVFLLSCDLYRKYRDFIPKRDSWWWTITGWSANPSFANVVWFVNTSGAFHNSNAVVSNGVVPSLLLNLKSLET